MISSMTGFGEAAEEVGGVAYTVEIRTVNNRYYKAHLRLPDLACFLEGEIDKLLRQTIHRGTVNYSLRMKNISGQAFFDLDENTLQSYLHKLESIARTSSVHLEVDLASMLGLPGIVQPAAPDEAWVEQMQATVLRLTKQALEQLRQMRVVEGRSLAEDLVGNCRVIEGTLDQIRARSTVVVEEYHQKLRRRVDELLSTAKLEIDRETLAREVAIYADRSDIAEEIARLQSHLDQFREHCRTEAHAGRRLDFISQEMLREANTIGSKSGDTEITRGVIEIKCSIDRIKEQVQNVE